MESNCRELFGDEKICEKTHSPAPASVGGWSGRQGEEALPILQVGIIQDIVYPEYIHTILFNNIRIVGFKYCRVCIYTNIESPETRIQVFWTPHIVRGELPAIKIFLEKSKNFRTSQRPKRSIGRTSN